MVLAQITSFGSKKITDTACTTSDCGHHDLYPTPYKLSPLHSSSLAQVTRRLTSLTPYKVVLWHGSQDTSQA